MFVYGLVFHFSRATAGPRDATIPLKIPEQIETATINLINLIQQTVWISTEQEIKRRNNCYPEHILQKIKLKR